VFFLKCYFFCFVLLVLDWIVFHQNDTSSSFRNGPELCLSQCSRPRNREDAPAGSFSLLSLIFPRSLAEKMWENENGIGCVGLFYDCSGAFKECCRI
jgi:hypothetical protein